MQCCDKYYERHLHAYLQVFLAFVTCIRTWFLKEPTTAEHDDQAQEVDVMKDVMEFAENEAESVRYIIVSETSLHHCGFDSHHWLFWNHIISKLFYIG